MSIFRLPYIFVQSQISIQYSISSEWKTSFNISHSISLLTMKSFSFYFFLNLFVFGYFLKEIEVSRISHLGMGTCLLWQLMWAIESTYSGVELGLFLVTMMTSRHHNLHILLLMPFSYNGSWGPNGFFSVLMSQTFCFQPPLYVCTTEGCPPP